MNRRQWLHRSALAASGLGISWVSGCGGRAPTGVEVGEERPIEMGARRKVGEIEGVDVLLFDVFGTVVDWRASLVSQFKQFGQQRGLSADWEALAIHWQADYLPSLEDVRNRRRPFVHLEKLRRESLDRLLPSIGLGKLAETDRNLLVRCWTKLEPWPDTIAGLTRLKRRRPIVAFSNGGFGFLMDLARHARLPWDAILSADLFRHFKPDAEVYQGAAELLARPAPSLLLVAAHNIDLAAARAYGLKTAYVQRSTEDAKPTASWDLVAQDFNDLADRLGS